MDSNTVTCSFVVERDIYNTYKNIVNKNGENVRDDIIRHMQRVISYDTPKATPHILRV